MPVTTGPIRASGVLSLESCASTVTRKISEPNIAIFNFTVQVSITSDPTIWRELDTLLANVILEEVGTAKIIATCIC